MPRAKAIRVADQAAAELVDLRRQQQLRAGFLERHQPAGDRYRAVVAELGWRSRATSRALECDPPAWLTGLLGDVPEAGRGGRPGTRPRPGCTATATATSSATPSGPLAPSRPTT